MLFALASCFGENHVYSGPCDPSCNECDRVTREPETEHTFTDCSDTECNACGEVRAAVAHTYKSACAVKCDICGAERTDFQAHIYDSPCDTDCNACGEVREASEHIYSNDCDTDCNFCGSLRVTTHVYSNDCDKTCNVCAAPRIPSAHVYSNDCDSTCDVCGELRMVPNHKYSSACDADCDVCGELRIAENHVYDHSCDPDCNVCGATRVVSEHIYDNACDPDCNNCKTVRDDIHNFTDWKSKTPANCDTAEVIARFCALCGVEETVEGAPALGHVFDHDCDTACNRAKCNYKREITHTYVDEFVTLMPATCTTAEILHRFCDICGYEDKANGEAILGHAFDHACDTTCNREDCDYVRVITHSFGDWVTKIPANCTDIEIEHRLCVVCKAEETRDGDVAALDHLYDHACDTTCNREGCAFVRVTEHVYDDNCDAVCNVEGCGFERIAPHTYDEITDLICNGCGHNRDCTGHLPSAPDCTICWVCGADIPDAVHVFGNWETFSAADCFKAEVEIRACANCKVTETQEGDPIRTHAFSFECDTTCDYEDCSYIRQDVEHLFDGPCDTTCNREACDYVRTVDHFFGDWETKSEANCTDAEIEHRICTECNAEETREGDKALDHAFDNNCDTDCNREGCDFTRTITHDFGDAWVTKSAATCVDPEILHQICRECGVASEATEIGEAALGHTYTNECDDTCDRECGTTRTPPHLFTDEHDVTCNNEGCDFKRPCNGHKALETDCTVCEYCGESIPDSEHTYANNCDTNCDVCGTEREVGEHIPSQENCTICAECGAAIEGAEHVALESDCTVCQNCDAGTGIDHVADPENCVLCKNCEQASGIAHKPNTDANCTQCEVCGKNLGTAHSDADGDGKCDNCPVEVIPGENWFPWAPL